MIPLKIQFYRVLFMITLFLFPLSLLANAINYQVELTEKQLYSIHEYISDKPIELTVAGVTQKRGARQQSVITLKIPMQSLSVSNSPIQQGTLRSLDANFSRSKQSFSGKLAVVGDRSSSIAVDSITSIFTRGNFLLVQLTCGNSGSQQVSRQSNRQVSTDNRLARKSATTRSQRGIRNQPATSSRASSRASSLKLSCKDIPLKKPLTFTLSQR